MCILHTNKFFMIDHYSFEFILYNLHYPLRIYLLVRSLNRSEPIKKQKLKYLNTFTQV